MLKYPVADDAANWSFPGNTIVSGMCVPDCRFVENSKLPTLDVLYAVAVDVPTNTPLQDTLTFTGPIYWFEYGTYIVYVTPTRPMGTTDDGI